MAGCPSAWAMAQNRVAVNVDDAPHQPLTRPLAGELGRYGGPMVDAANQRGAKNFVALGLSLLAVMLTAGVGGLAANSAQQYGRLRQPSWAPPSWLFGPVWTTLYALMAVAAWLVWRSGPLSATRSGLATYAAQLALNAAWTPLFFGLRWRGIALVDIDPLGGLGRHCGVVLSPQPGRRMVAGALPSLDHLRALPEPGGVATQQVRRLSWPRTAVILPTGWC